MAELVEAGGMVGTPENIAEFYRLVDCDPGEVKSCPPGGATEAPRRSRRNPARKPAGAAKSRPGANTEAARAAKTADERRIEAFEAKVIPFGRHAGKRWSEVPLSFVTWFAEFRWDKPAIRTLQIAVREYLELKYGIAVGKLF